MQQEKETKQTTEATIAGLTSEKREKLVAQALKEISHARIYKQGKITNWQKNENMYYDVKVPTTETRANVNLGRMQEFVHTIQSKINNQKIFKFVKRKESQVKRVRRFNALRDVDRDNNAWDMKILVGGKQLVIYGREIYSYYADSIDGIYRSHLENTDVYDFLIDPAAGGIDIEQGNYMGNYGVTYDRQQLEDGKKDGRFIDEAVSQLLAGVGNNTEQPQEVLNKRNRGYGQNTIAEKELQNDDKFRFWRWFTTFEGVRYYILLQEKTGSAIRIEKLSDMFTPNKYFPKGAWPYWTNAAFPDLTEFWTPSYCDYVREIFMAQDVSIDQMLDNSEAINKPMKIVNVSAIEDLAKLKYRRDRIIPTKGDYDANRAVQVLQTPAIEGPIRVFDVLEKIHEKASGVNAAAKGAADNNSGDKATIYLGNKAESQSRFNLLDMSRSFGISRFGRLYEIGVRDNLTKKVAIDMIGPDGIETEEVKRTDIFYKNDDFGMMIEDSQAEETEDIQRQVVKINFLNGELGGVNGKMINPKKAFEMKAKMAGYNEDEIKELLDTAEYGNTELMSEAARDIEAILDGETIKPNMNANNAYKQRFVDYMKDHMEDMTDEQFEDMKLYIDSLVEIVASNEARAVNSFAIDKLKEGLVPPGNPADGAGVSAPLTPVDQGIDTNAIQIQGNQAQ